MEGLFRFDNHYRRLDVDIDVSIKTGLKNDQAKNLYRFYWEMADDLLQTTDNKISGNYLDNVRLLANDFFAYGTNTPIGAAHINKSDLRIATNHELTSRLSDLSQLKPAVENRIQENLNAINLSFDNWQDQLTQAFRQTKENALDLHHLHQEKRIEKIEIESITEKPVILSNQTPIMEDRKPIEEQARALEKQADVSSTLIEKERTNLQEINLVQSHKEVSHVLDLLNHGTSDSDLIDVPIDSYEKRYIDRLREQIKETPFGDSHALLREELESRSVQMDPWEYPVADKLADSNPDLKRLGVYELEKEIGHYVSGIKEDRIKIKETSSILELSLAKNDSLFNILLNNERKFADDYEQIRSLGISKDVSRLLGWQKNVSEETIRSQIGEILQSASQMTNPIYLDGRHVKDSRSLNKQVRMFLSDSYNVDSERYKTFWDAMNIRRTINDFKSVMYDEERRLGNEILEYMDRKDSKALDRLKTSLTKTDYVDGIIVRKEPDIVDTDFYEDQARTLHNEMKKINDIYDQNEKAYQRFQKSIEAHEADMKELPRQPATMFRNAIESQFLENPNTADLQSLSNETVVQLQDLARQAKKNEEEARKKAGTFPSFKNENGQSIKSQEELANDLIIKQKGYTPDMSPGVTPHTIKALREIMEGNEEKGIKPQDPTYQKIRQRQDRLQTKKRWLDLYSSGATVKLKGSKVGYQIKGIDGDNAIIQKENVLLKDISFDPDFTRLSEDSIKSAIDMMDEMDQRDRVTVDELKDEAKMAGKQSRPFVEIKYETSAISEEIKSGMHPFVTTQMQGAADYMKTSAPDAFGVQHIYMTKEGLRDQFNGFWETLPDNNAYSTIKNRMMLPSYIVDMIQSHANFMMSDHGKVMGTAIEAMAQVFEDMTDGQKTLDLTTEGIVRRWKMANFGAADIEMTENDQALLQKFEEGLKGKSVTQRLEDAIFLDVLKEVHSKHFESEKRADRNHKLDIAVEELERQEIKPTPRNVYEALQSPYMSDFYGNYKSYMSAKNLTVEDIRDYMAESNREGTGSQLFFDDDGSAVGVQQGFQEHTESAENAFLNEEGIKQRVHGEEINKGLSSPGSEANYYSKRNLEDLFAFAKTQNMSEIKGTVRLPGTDVPKEAIFSKGNQGEFLAYVPSANKYYSITESANEGLDEVSTSFVRPQTEAEDLSRVKDIGYGGTPKQGSYGSYKEIQRSGDYAIPANPSVTVDEMVNFYSGKKPVTYIDIETTGLSSHKDYLPKDVLQPIEVYAQKIQWNPEEGRLHGTYDDNGNLTEATIKNRKGEDIVRDKQIYVSLTNRTRDYLHEVVEASDFDFTIQQEAVNTDGSVSVHPQTYSVIDYLEEQKRVQSGILQRGIIHEKILSQRNSAELLDEVERKSANLWFLRNIAKYMDDPENLSGEQKLAYNMHAGNTDLPNFVTEFQTKKERMRVGSPNASQIMSEVRPKQQAYIEQLKTDALSAADRLDRLSGKRGSGVVDIGTMYERITKFLGKSTVVGQNVGSADIGFLINSVDLWEGEAKQEQALLNHELTAFKNEFYDSRELLVQNLDEARNDMFEEFKSLLGESDDDGIINYYGQAQKGEYKYIGDWLGHISNKYQSGYKIGEKADLGSSKELLANITSVESLLDKFHEGGITIPDLSKEERELLTSYGADSNVSALSSIHQKIEENKSVIRQTDNEIMERKNTLQSALNDRSLIEQQFLSQWVNPDLDNHQSTTQLAAYGFDEGNYHLAKNDVKANIQLVNEYGKQLLSQEAGFIQRDIDGNLLTDSKGLLVTSFANKSYQPGDIVEMRKQIGESQKGLYQIQQMNESSPSIQMVRLNMDGSRTPMTIEARSNIELSRRFENHFSYVGSAADDAQAQMVAEEFHIDNTRRSILRSMDSSFNFDLTRMEAKEIGQYGAVENRSVRGMHSQLLSARQKINDHNMTPEGSPAPDFTLEERIALQNNHRIGSNDFFDQMNKEVTPERQMAIKDTSEFLNSEVGQKIGSFLKEVDQLEKVGAIGKTDRANIISEWNNRIKEEAEKKGAKRLIPYTKNLGSYGVNVAEGVTKEIHNMRLNTASTATIADSLNIIANRMMPLARSAGEAAKRSEVISYHLAPMLAQKGLVNNVSVGGKVTMNQLIQSVDRTIKNGGVNLPAYEQFDPTKLSQLGNDASFMQMMDQARTQLIGDTMSELTPLQQAHIQGMNEKEEYLRQKDLYIPGLDFDPDAQERMSIVTDTLSPNAFNEIGNIPTSQLTHYAKMFDGHSTGDVNTGNILFGELFNRATRGKNLSSVDVDELLYDGRHIGLQPPDERGWIEEGMYQTEDGRTQKSYVLPKDDPRLSDQVKAMEALNWVKEQPVRNAEGDIVGRALMPNPNIGDYYYGMPSEFAGRQLKNVPTDRLNEIAEQKIGTYTRDNSYNYMKRVIEQYKNHPHGEYPNHSGIEKVPYRQVVDGQGQKVNSPQKQDNEELKRLAREKKAAEGSVRPSSDRLVESLPDSSSQFRQDQFYNEFHPSAVDSTPVPERPIGRLEEMIQSGKQTAKESLDNFATALDIGPGGAGRWIAGLGIAAFALASFHKASSPLKLEERPAGHGVAGPTGQKEDEVYYGDQGKSPDPGKKPSTGKTVYANSGEKGYTVKARGKAGSDVNYEQMQKKMKQDIGEININMRDDRESLDRSWLENQFSSFIDRGSVGE